MAQFSDTTKHNANEFNNGNKYTTDDQLSIEALNNMIENSLYASNISGTATAIGVNQPDNTTANQVGVASVSIINGGTPQAKLKFSNLKGEQGEQGAKGDKGDKGDTGEQGIQGLKGDKGDKGDVGDTPIISVTATTLSSNQSATATISGTPENPLITFGIPKGEDGNVANISTIVSSTSTDDEVPSAKAVYDALPKMITISSDDTIATGGV